MRRVLCLAGSLLVGALSSPAEALSVHPMVERMYGSAWANLRSKPHGRECIAQLQAQYRDEMRPVDIWIGMISNCIAHGGYMEPRPPQAHGIPPLEPSARLAVAAECTPLRGGAARCTCNKASGGSWVSSQRTYMIRQSRVVAVDHCMALNFPDVH